MVSEDTDLQVDEASGDDEKPESKPTGNKVNAFISSLSSREKAIGVIAILIFVALLVDLMMIRPLSNHLNKLAASIEEKENIMPKRLMIFKHKDRINLDNQVMKEYLTSSKLTEEEEIAVLLREIERVSQQAGLFISNIHPVETKTLGENGYELSVDVEGVGGVQSLKNFIVELEQANPPVRVKAMNLRSQGPDIDELRYRFSVLKLGLKELK